MNRTLPEERIRTRLEKPFIVGWSDTMVGHCVNVRDLGKLAFFTLRSQTSSLQVVCTEKSVIDELRTIDEYSLVEVTGVIQEKQRRRGQDGLEHELNAKTLARVGRGGMRAPGLADGSADAQEIFKYLEPVVHDARLIGAARKVLDAWEITELLPPDALPFADRQALAGLGRENDSTAGEQSYCPHPPFHIHSRFLAAGGMHRFAFFSRTASGRRLLHIALCRPGPGEMPAIFGELAGVIFGDCVDGQQSKGGAAIARNCASAEVHSVGLNDGHPAVPWQSTDWPSGVHAQVDVDAILTVRERQLSAGFGLSERRVFYQNGAAIAHSCVLNQDFTLTEQMAAMLGDAASSVAAWRRIFCTGVLQSIPRMGMLTLLIDGLSDPACAVARKRGEAQSKAAIALSVDLAAGDSLNRACAVHVAQLAEAEQLRVELEILRGHTPEVGEIAPPMALEAALQTIESALPAYNLPLDLVHRLLGLCQRIHPEWRVERPVDLFQMLWTLLGSASVKFLLNASSSAMDVVRQLIEHRIISDKRQLLYMYPAVLPAVKELLTEWAGDERAALIVQLRTLMAQRPTLFATAVQTLAAVGEQRDENSQQAFDSLLRSVEVGIATPLLTRLISGMNDDRGLQNRLLHALRETGEAVFPNEAWQPVEVAAAFVDACPCDLAASLRRAGLPSSDELGREILYYLYRPVTMDYSMFRDMLSQLSDRTQDWAAWGVSGHGEFWNAALRCYEYYLDRGTGRLGKVRLYASKNVGSFFAKSTAGICTDINVELFNRPDHYHLNIIDADDGRAVGNVQLYSGEGGSGRFLMVRGINPVQGFCVNHGVDELVRCILHAIVDMAVFGKFSEVRLCEQNGLWNSDSSRAEVRACLKRMCAGMSLRPMEQLFHLYDYYERPLNVSAYYKIWESASGSSMSTDRTTE